jgi:serine/threonine protein kinase
MTPERWAEVNDVLHRAMELVPERRDVFLDEACAADDSLRHEVESLLAASDRAGSSFLQSSPAMRLVRGTQLDGYEIQDLLGAGGMGEVYRARDLRLHRNVAVKVLPAQAASDPDRLRRFEHEAMAAAALNHPNILAVFQMGTHEGAPYLVSELLEGQTLREQIERGGVSTRKAIDYAAQLARGLAAAHEKGVVHRDLKPENLFITPDGRVKILDFGLAKLMESQPSSDTLILHAGTNPGAVMGTVGYMSPEQVRGERADHRADIFAFGAIFYEMLTGKRAFQKPTAAETLAAILNEEPPPFSQTGLEIPPGPERIARRCLEKNREERFQSASDLAFAVQALSDPEAASTKENEQEWSLRGLWRSKTRTASVLFGAALLAFVLLALVTSIMYNLPDKQKLAANDSVVLADFTNSTGDPVFDSTLRQGLSAQLNQSPFLDLLSDERIAQTLVLMTHPKDARLTPEPAREVCVRTGSAVTIEGSISRLGSQYVLGLKAVNCQTGNSLAEEQVTANGKEQVLKALGAAATKIREKLGESLTSLEKYS